MRKSFVFTVTGAKSGIGKSVFAVNLAFSLLKETRSRILILDLDTSGCGDIASILGLKTVSSLTFWGDKLQTFDAKSLYEGITHHPLKISVLQLYDNLTDLKTYNPDLIDGLFSLLTKLFNFIIIDAGDSLDKFSSKAYEYSNLIFFLTTPDILVLNQAEKKFKTFLSMNLPGEMFSLILNKFNSRGLVSKAIVQKKLSKEVLLTIPDDEALVLHSINQAQPFTILDPGSPLTKCYDDLSHYIAREKVLAKLKAPAGAGMITDDLLVSLNPLIEVSGKKKMNEDLVSRKRAASLGKFDSLKERIHKMLIDKIDLKNFDPSQEVKDPKKFENIKNQTRETINKLLDEEGFDFSSIEERRKVAKEIYDEAIGLGPLEDLLADESVSEIMVNNKDQIFIERKGKIVLANITFTSEKALRGVIDRIVAPIGRRIDEKTPLVDARLKDGSRVNAVIPPLSIKGSMITIRKFSKDPLTYKDLVKFGAMTEEIADFLRACVEARLNIIISGGTGTGKTTLLNVMSSFIPSDERIITVEDSAELQLPQEHVATLESRPPNLQGENAITIRDLVKNTLRMRPDRIVVGECRGGEALDMLQAMNTGHDGSLTTIHANSPKDCVQRLETLVMFAGSELPSRAIREQISSAINIIVQLTRFSDGTRKITYISEIAGKDEDNIIVQDIFNYKQTGVNDKGKVVGHFVSTGIIPNFVETLKEKGIRIPKGLFSGDEI